MNKVIMAGLILLVLAGCSPLGGNSSAVDQLNASATAVQSTNVAAQNDLQTKINALEQQVIDLESSIASLTSERDTAVKQADEAKSSLDVVNKKVDSAQDIADEYKSLFLEETGDREGEFIFCSDAFVTSFSYIDKVSMRTEMIKYLADKRGYNKTSISSEHTLVWSNVSDGIIKLFGGGYMYPYLVAFEDSEFGRYNYVFDFSYSCFLDFPEMEKRFLAVE